MLCDGLLFDMDGTLWDAVDSYIHIWNDTFAQLGIQAQPVTRNRLMGTMGLTLEQILTELVPNLDDVDAFLKVLDANETSMMPVLGGVLYPGVQQTLKQLSEKLPLYLVSNCGSYGLANFMQYTGLKPLFTDAVSHGENGFSKAQNIKLIVERHGLKHPVYVGDTQTDCLSAHSAGVSFVWAAYGFGRALQADATINDISELPDYLRTQ